MSIRTIILLPISLLLFIIGCVSAFTWIELAKTKATIDAIRKNNEVVDSLSTRIGWLRDRTRQYTLFYSINQDPSYLNIIEVANMEITELIEQERQLITNSHALKLLADFEAGREFVTNSRQEYLKAIDSKSKPAIDKSFKIFEIHNDINTALLTDFIRFNRLQVIKTNDLYETMIERTFMLGNALIALTFAMLIAVFIHFDQVITNPLKSLTLIAKKISVGEYDINIPKYHSQEIGSLANNLRIMSKRLKEFVETSEELVKKREYQLKKMKEFENQKDLFISIASHELKTPLTSLKVYVDLLKKKVHSLMIGEQQAMLEKMDNQISKLSKLIYSLLDVTRIRANKMHYEMKMFDINHIVMESVKLARKITTDHLITLEANAREMVFGDSNKISQVIDNLLSNAIKYSPKGGMITVSTKAHKKGVMVSIADTGLGIDKTHHKKIFKHFYRTEMEDEPTYPGLGLGLYICSEIIKRHNGAIWVESEKGKGSTFRFTIPTRAT